MKIAVFADLHGVWSHLSRISKAREISDLILVCGDLGGKRFDKEPDFDDPDRILKFGLLQREYVEKLESLASERNLNLKFILGNDDWFDWFHAPDSDYHLFEPLGIGDGYTLHPFTHVPITPFTTNRECNENELAYRLSKLGSIDATDIIVAHGPPRGHRDLVLRRNEHVGSTAALEFIREKKPAVWLCGHIHEDFGESAVYHEDGTATLVLNAASDGNPKRLRGWLLDTENLDHHEISI